MAMAWQLADSPYKSEGMEDGDDDKSFPDPTAAEVDVMLSPVPTITPTTIPTKINRAMPMIDMIRFRCFGHLSIVVLVLFELIQ